MLLKIGPWAERIDYTKKQLYDGNILCSKKYLRWQFFIVHVSWMGKLCTFQKQIILQQFQNETRINSMFNSPLSWIISFGPDVLDYFNSLTSFDTLVKTWRSIVSKSLPFSLSSACLLFTVKFDRAFPKKNTIEYPPSHFWVGAPIKCYILDIKDKFISKKRFYLVLLLQK